MSSYPISVDIKYVRKVEAEAKKRKVTRKQIADEAFEAYFKEFKIVMA